jgi:hypothetical protein
MTPTEQVDALTDLAKQAATKALEYTGAVQGSARAPAYAALATMWYTAAQFQQQRVEEERSRRAMDQLRARVRRIEQRLGVAEVEQYPDPFAEADERDEAGVV